MSAAPNAATSTAWVGLTQRLPGRRSPAPSRPVLLPQVAEEPWPEEEEGQAPFARGEHDLLPGVPGRLAQDVVQPALERHHVLQPTRRGTRPRPGKVELQAQALLARHRPDERVGR